jgi:hypothetical protein
MVNDLRAAHLGSYRWISLESEATPWASVAERGREARGGVNRQGREKRRRRSEAGLETRDEEAHIVWRRPARRISRDAAGRSAHVR